MTTIKEEFYNGKDYVSVWEDETCICWIDLSNSNMCHSLKEENDKLHEELAEAHKNDQINMKALQELTGSNNIQNPWLGIAASVALMKFEIKDLSKWIDDLQSEMYVNCAYCGHRYGPRKDTSENMREVLKKHIESCPKHPMSELKLENEQLLLELSETQKQLDEARRSNELEFKNSNREVIDNFFKLFDSLKEK